MSKNNLIEFKGREAEFEGRAASVDPLSEPLQTGAEKLIHQAVEAELYAQLGQYADRAPRLAMREWFAMAACRSERFKPASGQALKGLPVTSWHASYDVQAGPVCGEKMASPARL